MRQGGFTTPDMVGPVSFKADRPSARLAVGGDNRAVTFRRRLKLVRSAAHGWQSQSRMRLVRFRKNIVTSGLAFPLTGDTGKQRKV